MLPLKKGDKAGSATAQSASMSIPSSSERRIEELRLHALCNGFLDLFVQWRIETLKETKQIALINAFNALIWAVAISQSRKSRSRGGQDNGLALQGQRIE